MVIMIKRIMYKVVQEEMSLIVTSIKLNLNMMTRTSKRSKKKLISKKKKKKRRDSSLWEKYRHLHHQLKKQFKERYQIQLLLKNPLKKSKYKRK